MFHGVIIIIFIGTTRTSQVLQTHQPPSHPPTMLRLHEKQARLGASRSSIEEMLSRVEELVVTTERRKSLSMEDGCPPRRLLTPSQWPGLFQVPVHNTYCSPPPRG